jgi:hypothetical protein
MSRLDARWLAAWPPATDTAHTHTQGGRGTKGVTTRERGREGAGGAERRGREAKRGPVGEGGQA